MARASGDASPKSTSQRADKLSSNGLSTAGVSDERYFASSMVLTSSSPDKNEYGSIRKNANASPANNNAALIFLQRYEIYAATTKRSAAQTAYAPLKCTLITTPVPMPKANGSNGRKLKAVDTADVPFIGFY